MFKSFILGFLSALILYTVLIQAHPKIISTSKPSDFVLQETKKWMGMATPFKNSSADEEMSKSIADLLSWKTPDYYVKHFPYYLSGLSYEKTPIYILECGKYDMVALMRQGPEVVDKFNKFFAQILVRALKTLEPGGLDGKNHRTNLILDFEGFTYAQYASISAIDLMMRVALQYIPFAGEFVEKFYIINGNFAVDTLIKTFRPVLGQLSERIEIYGPKKSKWLKVLTREFPPEALPSWYGGSANFTPIAAYG